VVARRTYDGYIVLALPGRHAAAYSVGLDDVPRIDILELGITGR
jgi:hypothetical protein